MTPMTQRVIRTFKHLYVKGKVKSKSDFCRRIDYSIQSWYNVENGYREFPPEKIDDLIRVFNVSKDYLINNRTPIIAPKFTKKFKQFVNN